MKYIKSKHSCDSHSCGSDDVWEQYWVDYYPEGSTQYHDILCYDCGRYVGTSGLFAGNSLSNYRKEIDECRQSLLDEVNVVKKDFRKEIDESIQNIIKDSVVVKEDIRTTSELQKAFLNGETLGKLKMLLKLYDMSLPYITKDKLTPFNNMIWSNFPEFRADLPVKHFERKTLMNQLVEYQKLLGFESSV